MREGFFGGSKNKDEQPVDAMVDDMGLDEMTGQVKPVEGSLERHTDLESKRIFKDLGFDIGDQVQKDFSGSIVAAKKGKITGFTYSLIPNELLTFLAQVEGRDNKGKKITFTVTREEIQNGKVKKL